MRPDSAQHIHILGIGGSGLSAIAQLLLEQGLQVSGCDRAPNAATAALERQGVRVLTGHAAGHLVGAQALLVTSAVTEEHPELRAAREQGLAVLTRHDLWRSWSQQRPVVAVSGSHGKTTTTGMLAHMLVRSGHACGYLIGAPVAGLGAARWGDGPLVIEADEYARTFLALLPQVAVVLNVDWDHVDIYPTQPSYDAAFREFASTSLEQDGAVIACGDDPGVRRALADLPLLLYGLEPDNRWRATRLRQAGAVQHFVVERDGQAAAEVALPLSGRHNVLNALGALAAATLLGLDLSSAAQSLADFRGAARRFEPKGQAQGVAVFDDYAHHPQEIRATLQAARSRFPERRLVAYFQPHTFSRLQAFLPDFATALAAADVVCVGAIYAAREASATVSAEQIVQSMRHGHARYVGDLAQAVAALLATLQPGDVLLTLGAGDGYLVGERVLEALGSDQKEQR